MNVVIETLTAFVSGADKDTLNKGLEQARQEHDRYILEMARIFGVTLTPATPIP